MALGLGLLGAFFLLSIVIIASRGSSRLQSADDANSLSKTEIEGSPLPSTPGAEVPALNGTPNLSAGFVLNEFHRSLVKDGKTVWEVFGKRGRYNPLGNVAEVEEPRLTVTQKANDKATLIAARAILSLTGTDLAKAELFDDVVVTYKDDTTLKAQYATYDKTTNTVTIPDIVEIDSSMASISGKMLDGDLENQIFTIKRSVTTIIKPRGTK